MTNYTVDSNGDYVYPLTGALTVSFNNVTVQANTWYPLSYFLTIVPDSNATFAIDPNGDSIITQTDILETNFGGISPVLWYDSYLALNNANYSVAVNGATVSTNSQLFGIGYNSGFPAGSSVYYDVPQANETVANLANIKVEFSSSYLATAQSQNYSVQQLLSAASGSHVYYLWGYDGASGGYFEWDPATVFESSVNSGTVTYDSTSLFTTGADEVNFNNLSPTQVAAINSAPAQLYNAMGGSDTITLPNELNGAYTLSPTVSATWDPTQTFVVGALTDTTSTNDTITGGTGNPAYNIDVVGPATASITINGNGNSTITAGSGADTISITGTGTNSVTTGSGSETLSIAGGGSIDVLGTFVGSGSIGANSTLELSSSASGGPITFAGADATLQIAGTAMPTNTLENFVPGDSIDLTGVPYKANGIATLIYGDALQISENGMTYVLNVEEEPTKGESFQLSSDGSGGTNIQIGPGNAGFDSGNFPGLKAMEELYAETNLSWAGYYLTSPLYNTKDQFTPWAGNWQSLTLQGWKLAPIFVGQQNYSSAPVTLVNAASLATADSKEAVTDLTITDHVPKGTVVYLDVESNANLNLGELAYIADWCSDVSSAGYLAGVYCAFNQTSTIAQIVPGTPLWIIHTGIIPTVPNDGVILPTPSLSLAGNAAGVEGWQYLIKTYSFSPNVASLSDIDLDSFANTGTAIAVAAGQPITNVTIGNGNYLNDPSGITASDVVINDGGTEYVYGLDVGATINDGGYQYVMPGGAATNAVVLDPGIQIVSSGATANNTILSGGMQGVYGTASGTVINTGGIEEVFPGGTTENTTINGGTLILDAGAIVGVVDFSNGGTLKIEGTSIPDALVVEGFSFGDSLDLTAVPFANGTATLSGDTLDVFENGQHYYIQLSSTPSGPFILSSDAGGGTDISLAEPSTVPDFAHVTFPGILAVNAAHGVLADDTDPVPHDMLTVSAVDWKASNVGHALVGGYGTLTLDANGSYTYLANHLGLPLSGVGIDTFSYTAADGDGGTANSTLTIVVTSAGQTYVGGTAGTTIKGGFGLYVLDGLAGTDTLIAGIGIQVLIGGSNDTLTAALGFDTFAFAPNFGMNTIKNFNPILDSIQLPKSEFANFAAVQGDMQQVGANTVITYDAADVITLTGIRASNLHASDFHFA
jgi:autotransporter passenger strand-loop-strand repeat protein/VCBS repeat-containing protein